MLKSKVFTVMAVAALVLLLGCAPQAQPPATESDEAADTATDESGTLTLLANGEDFVREGFISKDGWQIDFNHVFVTLADVTAYQTDPPFDASTGETPDGTAVSVAETLTLDLAEGDESADPLLIEAVSDAPAGQYNAFGWRMVNAAEGDYAGYTVVLDGTAEKDGETVEFVIKVETEYTYNCGEYVGDERKGILAADGEADLEATFHFDHVFGDADASMEEALNMGAVGFDPLAAIATDGLLDIDMAGLQESLSEEDFTKMVDTLATLGHVGEGHCYEAQGGYTGHFGEAEEE